MSLVSSYSGCSVESVSKRAVYGNIHFTSSTEVTGKEKKRKRGEGERMWKELRTEGGREGSEREGKEGREMKGNWAGVEGE